MSKLNLNTILLTVIAILLLLLLLKPQIQGAAGDFPAAAGESIVSLGEGKIGIVDSSKDSGNYGKILIFDFNSETNNFVYKGTFDYSDYIRNPQK
ncbi:hypothetical protein CBW65_07555 [Tumebacillus avium]|uniref:Uncharacterized protein n=1 Tax=Tumebacillus avium TaxID=1903704 RepID=A0A1Y0IMB1_9BACL|nr:hypothetical protein [Tumebacillus avium]ARU60956.1 hypothetical protein CBW65_07555 [Tumebacillus avium]